MRILSIDGGGYLGLASARFVMALEQHFGTSSHQRFDLFCGTSTGAIIALALASGMTGEQIVKLYKKLGKEVFNHRLVRLPRWIFWAKYGNVALRAALEDAFGDTTLGDLQKKQKLAIITSFCLTSGQARIFKTDHSTQLSLHNTYKLSEIALASAAAPTFFPIVPLTNRKQNIQEYFCDGGVVANHPALIGFSEAVSELSILPGDVQLLSISTPRTNLAKRKYRGFWLSKGFAPWALPLSKIFIEANALMSHELIKRLVRAYNPTPIYERIQLQNDEGLAMDSASEKNTVTLERIGSEAASSTDVRKRLANFYLETEEEKQNGKLAKTL